VPDILHDFPIHAPAARVFDAISTARGLDAWWAEESSGEPLEGTELALGFGPEYRWRARVVRSRPPVEFEIELTHADADWTGSRVGFVLEPNGEKTQVHFRHVGWPQPNEHWRISCFCWAMYLRLLRRYVEQGEVVPYHQRLDV